MGTWSGKYVIGLTGNIATGKSIVRKMLEHLGAYGIDADSLAHRAIAAGAPAYQPVLDYFGRWLLNEDGQIDRAKLGSIAFSNPECLAKLEEIIHPFVRQAVDILVRRSPQKIVVIEAIKLLEGPLRDNCNAIWVTTSPEETQVKRLMKKRGISREAALVRIQSQNPQAEKIKAADVIIMNNGSVEDIWKQVAEAWRHLKRPEELREPARKPQAPGILNIRRATPREAGAIASLITRLSGGKRKIEQTDVMSAFGEKAFMTLVQDDALVGLVGWQVENLVARVIDFYMDQSLNLEKAIPMVIESIESASKELQSEAILVFIPPALVKQQRVWMDIGYEPRTAQNLSVRAWQEAALESGASGTIMLFKQLRKDRVLRPI